MGMQVERVNLESELESSGPWTAVQSSNQNMQTLHPGTVLDHQKTSPCNPQPLAGNWNLLPSCQELTFENHQESESAGLR